MTRSYTDRLGRFVCVLQRRETDDFLAPAWWFRRCRPGATQHFLLVGVTEEVQTPVGMALTESASPPAALPRSFRGLILRAKSRGAPAPRPEIVRTAPDAQGMLRGRVHVMPWQEEPSSAATQDALFDELRQCILATDRRYSDAQLDALSDEVAADIAERSLNSVALQFALFRTGEVRIWFDDAEGDRLAESGRVELAKQSYFFIKDMVHHHVHHDPKSDQITPLTNVGGERTGQGEEHWRRDTAWSLSRAVDALARRGKLQDLREATGILAYADAFQKTLLVYRRRADDPSRFEPSTAVYRYDYAHIRESLRVQLDQVTARRTIRAQMIVAGLAGGIAGMSLLASVISAHNGGIKAKAAFGTPVLPGVPDGFLQAVAALPLLPPIVCGVLLWLLSEHFLSEDRIGARRAGSRKGAQLIRGLLNSAAKRKPRLRDGAWVQRWIERFYLVVASALFGVMVYFTPKVAELGRRIDGALMSIGTAAPAQAPTPAASPFPLKRRGDRKNQAAAQPATVIGPTNARPNPYIVTGGAPAVGHKRVVSRAAADQTATPPREKKRNAR